MRQTGGWKIRRIAGLGPPSLSHWAFNKTVFFSKNRQRGHSSKQFSLDLTKGGGYSLCWSLVPLFPWQPLFSNKAKTQNYPHHISRPLERESPGLRVQTEKLRPRERQQPLRVPCGSLSLPIIALLTPQRLSTRDPQTITAQLNI